MMPSPGILPNEKQKYQKKSLSQVTLRLPEKTPKSRVASVHHDQWKSCQMVCQLNIMYEVSETTLKDERKRQFSFGGITCVSTLTGGFLTTWNVYRLNSMTKGKHALVGWE